MVDLQTRPIDALNCITVHPRKTRQQIILFQGLSEGHIIPYTCKEFQLETFTSRQLTRKSFDWTIDSMRKNQVIFTNVSCSLQCIIFCCRYNCYWRHMRFHILRVWLQNYYWHRVRKYTSQTETLLLAETTTELVCLVAYLSAFMADAPVWHSVISFC